MADQPGFEIYGKFYPLVPVSDWLNQDFILSRVLTRFPIEIVIEDWMLFEQSLTAVSIWHQQKNLSMDQVIEFVYALNPNEVTEVGLKEESSDPPADTGEDGAPSSSSSPISGQPTAATPAT